MTVQELIAKLSAFPSDMLVVVAGFDESGYSDVETIEQVRIIDTGFMGHAGRYRDDDDRTHKHERRAGPFEAVYIDF